MTNEEKPTHSLALRLRRVTIEDAYIAIPVTEAILEQKTDGDIGLNMDAFIAEALRISALPQLDWQIESRNIEPHPTQTPLPEGRSRFDPEMSGE